MSDDTLFQAGSISKSLTAWGILHLVDEGRLLLDDPVGKYLTKWKLPNSEFNNNEVTIRRLLSHTAGLSAHKGYLGVAPGKHLDSIEESLSEKDGLMNQWKLPKTRFRNNLLWWRIYNFTTCNGRGYRNIF